MIRYTLKCSTGHSFESWFASGAAFDALRDAGQLECVICGDRTLDRAPMAPPVRTARSGGPARQAETAPHADPGKDAQHSLSAPPDSKLTRMVRALRARIERDTEYVGPRFAQEARAIHAGDAPERAIRGEADPRDARRLVEDGIPVLPLPFADSKKTH